MRSVLSIAAALTALSVTSAHAATATQTFGVQLTITTSCTVNSATTMDFGSSGVLTSNIDQSSTITVQCTNTTPYNVGLSAGVGPGATVSSRKMSNGAATVGYALYSDAGRTMNWGATVGTDTVSATGNGAAQPFTVYGRVPAQTTPAAGSYADTITVTVSY